MTPPLREIFADLVVLQQAARGLNITMSTSPEPSPVNGLASPSADEYSAHVANGIPSDSDLSDARPAAVDVAPPESDDAAGSPDEEPGSAREEHEEQSDSSENDAQDDGDFDTAGSPASVQSNDDADRAASASASPRRLPKRKAPQVIEDDYMRENPELYGLRRSVWYHPVTIVVPGS